MVQTKERQVSIDVTFTQDGQEFHTIGLTLDGKIISVSVAPKNNGVPIPQEVRNKVERTFRQLGYKGTTDYIQQLPNYR